jgi:FtsZ-binding cell division protein ZapB
MDELHITVLLKEIEELKERLIALEKEQRQIREDILSGTPKERMQRRLLENPEDRFRKIKFSDPSIKI